MPRFKPHTKEITFQPGSVMVGRMVKTARYSPELVNIINRSNVPIPEKDIVGWCGLNFTVVEVHRDNNTVTLKYNIPKTRNHCVNIAWPVAGLCTVSPIKV